LAGHAMYSQLADEPEALVGGGLDASRPESELGKARDVEKIRRADVSVALRVVGVDAAGIDLRRDGRGLCVAFVEAQLGAPAIESAPDFGDQHVPDDEADRRVSNVDGPRPHGSLPYEAVAAGGPTSKRRFPTILSNIRRGAFVESPTGPT